MTALAVLALAVVGLLLQFGGERLTEIDVNSGRLRERVLVFGIVIREKVRETPFSGLVARHIGEATPPKYEPAYAKELGLMQLGGGGHTDYARCGAILPMNQLPGLFELFPSARAREAEIVTHMLTLLREDRAREMPGYLNEVFFSSD